MFAASAPASTQVIRERTLSSRLERRCVKDGEGADEDGRGADDEEEENPWLDALIVEVEDDEDVDRDREVGGGEKMRGERGGEEGGVDGSERAEE